MRIVDSTINWVPHVKLEMFCHDHLVEALIEDREPVIDVYESIAMTAPGVVAHESALLGGVQMDVPSFDPEA